MIDNKDVLFLLQYKSCGSSSRGIQSGGIILTIEDLKDELYVRQLLRGRWSLMYQVGRQVLKSVKSMSLQEFEQIFGIGNTIKLRYLLDFDSNISSPFRKEITQVYGLEAFRTKPQMTTRYNSGDVIRCSDGNVYLYYGYLKKFLAYIDNNEVCDFTGHLYMPLTDKKNSRKSLLDKLDVLVQKPSRYKEYVLKSKRKAEVNSIRSSNIKLKGDYTYDTILPVDIYHRDERKARVIMEIGD